MGYHSGRSMLPGHILTTCCPEVPSIRCPGLPSGSKVSVPAPTRLWDPQPGWSCSAILLDRHRQLMVFSLATFCVPQFSSVFMSPVFQLPRLLASFLFLAESQLVPEYTIHLASDFLSYPRQHWPPLCPLPPDTCFWGPLFINTREFSSVMLLDFFIMITSPCGCMHILTGDICIANTSIQRNNSRSGSSLVCDGG